ncbi:hypothetical protein OPV22_023617 [Ensete ventricosum]|uniref:Uncharacterized protein n=1 Tax=Ensete ventricosum TaxID=4639 RepID=A0AAV8QV05_ENSVE|nr:hypothetical protein OPV22_023617 [Ensete ventricosum]RWW53495.1 hypothetical protein BHE74_00040028 [Ensete ventricosum]RZS13149.1 hypothetical protein BHM03_00044683 [Ensete ventricosum]
MRAGAGFNTTAEVVPSAAAGGGGHSGWHSPVPYLFGGLAAMLGLIAFALLLLVCSYWRLSRRRGGDADPDPKTWVEVAMPAACYEEKVVVIMAGDEKPTYLATPISSPASLSFGDHSNKGDHYNDEEEEKKIEDISGTGNETQNKEQIHGQRENQNLGA